MLQFFIFFLIEELMLEERSFCFFCSQYTSFFQEKLFEIIALQFLKVEIRFQAMIKLLFDRE